MVADDQAIHGVVKSPKDEEAYMGQVDALIRDQIRRAEIGRISRACLVV